MTTILLFINHSLSVVVILLSSLSCSGRSFLTGPWPDVHTAEKCKYWNNSWVFPKTVSFFTHYIFSVSLFPALLLVAGTPGGGACCASCCSSSSPPPQQDLWWVSVCVTVYGYLEEFLFFCILSDVNKTLNERPTRLLLLKCSPSVSDFRSVHGRRLRALKGSTFRGCFWSSSLCLPWWGRSTGGVWKSATPYPTSRRQREGRREKGKEGRKEGR